MIDEPQRTYLLELLLSLGDLADHFVLAGAQAMKFSISTSRATRDFDFVLDVVAIREIDTPLREVLNALGYEAVPKALHFQFEKAGDLAQERMSAARRRKLDLLNRMLTEAVGFE